MKNNQNLLIEILRSPGYPELKSVGFKERYAILKEAHKNTKAGRKLAVIFISSFGLSLLMAHFLNKLGVEGGPIAYAMLATLFLLFVFGYYYLSYTIVSPEVRRILSKSD